MHKAHIVIAGSLLLSASCMMPADEVAADTQAMTEDSALSPESTAIASFDRAADDTQLGNRWTCVARYEYCEDDDDHGDGHEHHGSEHGGFERCHITYYYAVNDDKHEAHHEALDRCEGDNPDDWWACEVARCYR